MKKVFLILMVLFIAGVTSAEIIKLNNGKVIEGKIIEKTDDYIKVDTGIGVATTYYMDEIVKDNEEPKTDQKVKEEIPKESLQLQDSAKPKTVVDGNNAFGLDLYANLKDTPGNLFFSPYSISTALAMTYAGARGETEKQMAQVLHFALGQNELHPAFSDLQAQLNAIQGKGVVELSVANSLWGQTGHVFLNDFLELTNKYYGAALNNVDYIKDAEGARVTINTWVENKTKNKIQNLIQPGVLTPSTRLVLTNAIYFKGKWASVFKAEDTFDRSFWLSKENEIKVPMMGQTKSFKYMENENIQALELPYKGNDLSMLVLLPKAKDGLSQLENIIKVEALNSWIGELNWQDVAVSLPKFKMTSSFELADKLAAIGMSDAFDPDKADFSGMDGITDMNQKLYISNVIHKAFVDVNEEGTEAAAATAVVMSLKSIAFEPESPKIFLADHPFMFLIRENSTGSILFFGRVANPTE